MKEKKRLLSVILIFVLCIAMVGGCGGKEPAAEEEKGQKQAESKEGLETLTFVFPRSYETLDDAALHAAIEQGYFEEAGVNLVLQQAMGVDDLKMLVAGEADVAFPSSFVQIAGHQNELEFISVHQVDNINIFGYCVKPDSGIKSIADLKGKSIALGDAAWSTISDPILIAAGVDPKDVTYVTSGENRAQLTDAGQCDAVLTWYKEFELWAGQGLTFDWLAGEDVVQLEGSSLCFAKKYVDENKELISKFLQAYAMGSYFTYLNPAAATEITLKKFPSINIEFKDALESVKSLVYIDNGEDVEKEGYGWHNPKKWEAQIEACKKAGTLTRDLSLDEIYTNEFVENTNKFDHERVEKDAASYELAPENQEYALTNSPRK